MWSEWLVKFDTLSEVHRLTDRTQIRGSDPTGIPTSQNFTGILSAVISSSDLPPHWMYSLVINLVPGIVSGINGTHVYYTCSCSVNSLYNCKSVFILSLRNNKSWILYWYVYILLFIIINNKWFFFFKGFKEEYHFLFVLIHQYCLKMYRYIC